MILAVFLAYLALLVFIGIYYTRSNRALEDFVLGGRRLGPWVAAISAEASDMSGWLLIGLPAAAYAGGFSILWAVIGCTAGTLFNWLVVAPRLHRAAAASGAMTIPDFLEARFAGKGAALVRLVSVGIILVFYATYISAQFIAAGKIFETAFCQVQTPWGVVSFTYVQGILIGCGMILFYTAMGGFMAVAMTDLIQGLLMVVAVCVLPVLGIAQLGGLERLWEIMGQAVEGQALLDLSGGRQGTGSNLASVHGGRVGQGFSVGCSPEIRPSASYPCLCGSYGEDGFWAIEVKNSGKVYPQDTRSLRAFQEDYPECEALLLYRGAERLKLGRILCPPCEEFLTQLHPSASRIDTAF